MRRDGSQPPLEAAEILKNDGIDLPKFSTSAPISPHRRDSIATDCEEKTNKSHHPARALAHRRASPARSQPSSTEEAFDDLDCPMSASRHLDSRRSILPTAREHYLPNVSGTWSAKPQAKGILVFGKKRRLCGDSRLSPGHAPRVRPLIGPKTSVHPLHLPQ